MLLGCSSWQLRGSSLRGQAGPAHLQQGVGSTATQLRPSAELGGSGRAGSSGSGEGEPLRRGGRPSGRRRKARHPGLFEVEDVSPPKRSLGIHALPPNTHNGDQIEVEGSSYVVQSVVLQFKLVRGKYRRDHARLEVQNTGRMLATLFLEGLYQREALPGADGSSGGGGSGGGNGPPTGGSGPSAV